MNDIIRTTKSLENSLNGVVTKTVKHEIKKQEGGFLSALIAPLAAQTLGRMLTRRRVSETEKKTRGRI